jgi:hypothetical protein
MAGFIRPEARAALWRWREVLAALLLAVVGLWWGLTSFGLLMWLGWAMCGGGAVLAFIGVQRVRFARSGGIGVVTVDERRVAYFGPLTGGVVDLDDLARLEIEPEAYPAPHWILTGQDGTRVEIPVDATGSDVLFDAFAALPGLRTGVIVDVLSRTPAARTVLWAREMRQLH